MAYSIKSSISFGLVYIPVSLYPCAKNNDISFNLIDKKTLSRVKYKRTCVDCDGKELKPEDIVKGYEYDDGSYVILEDKDFEKIKSKRDKTITIEKFAPLSGVDPVYYDKAYYVSPAGAERAFSLLLSAMEQKNMAGIAKTVLGYKDTLILLRVKGGRMLLNTMYFDEEIQKPSIKETEMAIRGKELELAVSLIENMSGRFNPAEYKDEYRGKLMELIDSKLKGKSVSIPKERTSGNVVNIMDALKMSIETVQKASPKARAKSAAAEQKEEITKVYKEPAAASRGKKSSSPQEKEGAKSKKAVVKPSAAQGKRTSAR